MHTSSHSAFLHKIMAMLSKLTAQVLIFPLAAPCFKPLLPFQPLRKSVGLPETKEAVMHSARSLSEGRVHQCCSAALSSSHMLLSLKKPLYSSNCSFLNSSIAFLTGFKQFQHNSLLPQLII